MLDLNKPVQTRDGREVRILCADLQNNSYPLAVAVADTVGMESLRTYTEDGIWDVDWTGGPHAMDLVNVPEEIVRYANVYEESLGYFFEDLENACNSVHSIRKDYRGRLKLTFVDDKLTKAEVV